MMRRRLAGCVLLIVAAVAGCATSSSHENSMAYDFEPPRPDRVKQVANPPTDNQQIVYIEPLPSTQPVAHQEELPEPADDALFEGVTTVEQLIAYAVNNNAEIGAARYRAEAMISRARA